MVRQKHSFRNPERRLTYQVACAYSVHDKVMFRGVEIVEAFSSAQAKLVAALKFREAHHLSEIAYVKMSTAPVRRKTTGNAPSGASPRAWRLVERVLISNPSFDH